MTPLREVRRNEAFSGKSDNNFSDLTNYQHFRKVALKEKKEQLDRDEGIYNPDFLDEITTDYPAGAWFALTDTTGQVALLRNRLWPGYYGYHKINTPIFGGLYIGDGICN
jgi:radial spoke head protein 9